MATLHPFLLAVIVNFFTFSEPSPIPLGFQLDEEKSTGGDGLTFHEYLKIHYPKPWTNEDETRNEIQCNVNSRNALAYGSRLWENGTVPYVVRNISPHNLEMLNTAFAYYHNFTCVRFRPIQEGDEDYILIDGNSTYCSSTIGREGGEQFVHLSDLDCFSKVGTPFHELMHTLGFDHEHSRHDRDQYIIVNTQNIAQEDLDNFEVVNGTSYGLDYDFGSVMHYSLYAFSVNESIPTIIPKLPLSEDVVVGQRVKPSDQDLLKVNLMYKCPQSKRPII